MSKNTHEPVHSSDLVATLRSSQQAPMILGRQFTPKPIPFPGQPEGYETIEQLFFSCLQTGDDKSALICLDKLTQAFGYSNEKIIGLRGLYGEAMAVDYPALENCLSEYDTALAQDPANLPVSKRRVALLRSMSRPSEAITSLVNLLETTPTDAEAWCELADLYKSQGMSAQAIFCVEEALLITPNAWNVHAYLAELLYACASSQEAEDSLRSLERSARHYCRSVELCDGYLRGFYGLALVTSHVLSSQGSGPGRADEDTLTKLNAFAFRKLRNIVRSRVIACQGQGCSQSELIAVKELLNRFGRPV